MARTQSDQPTELELEFLNILWDDAPRLVRDIRQELAQRGRDIAHTSVITTLNTMVKKKYLKRTKQGKAFLFAPRVTRNDVSQQMLAKVVDRAFGGSARAVLLSLFDCADINNDEIKELRRLIDHKAQETSE
ncbi:Methicillin resistance regulatory protein MecI [Symmachiella dynata]|uniref:BlaI/MecI/CopY family transcriptional regulator n=1 Tax=Symmachiella dynata TaxID=2527995 RepID=UPI00118C2518|nr:BlaI/MecI/CopY family transcriptional regulator [Symmachiella dynata]QDT50104.1 Methicillin resistance regulatory protein MecI [Symmachiella dynata]